VSIRANDTIKNNNEGKRARPSLTKGGGAFESPIGKIGREGWCRMHGKLEERLALVLRREERKQKKIRRHLLVVRLTKQ